MKKICFISFMLLLSYITYVYAQEKASEEYIIQKSDTLWDISNSKLQDPFLWPKLWDVNPHISNPDLIYPGEKITIPSREELMRQAAPSEQEEPQVMQEPQAMQEPQEVKKPKTRAARTVPAVRKPLTEVKPSKKFLIDKNRYVSIGWISEQFPGIGEIISTPSGRDMSGNDDTVYINIPQEEMMSLLGLEGKPALLVADSKNQFLTIRDIKEVKHPISGKSLGHLIRVTGIVELTGFDQNTSKAKIIRSFNDEVEVGDSLIPYTDTDPPLTPDVIRTPRIDGYVVESLFDHTLSSEGDIVFLDKGENDGLQAGDVLSVFSNSPVQRVIGKLQVISLQPSTSASVILQSDEEIKPGLVSGQK